MSLMFSKIHCSLTLHRYEKRIFFRNLMFSKHCVDSISKYCLYLPKFWTPITDGNIEHVTFVSIYKGSKFPIGTYLCS